MTPEPSTWSAEGEVVAGLQLAIGGDDGTYRVVDMELRGRHRSAFGVERAFLERAVLVLDRTGQRDSASGYAVRAYPEGTLYFRLLGTVSTPRHRDRSPALMVHVRRFTVAADGRMAVDGSSRGVLSLDPNTGKVLARGSEPD